MSAPSLLRASIFRNMAVTVKHSFLFMNPNQMIQASDHTSLCVFADGQIAFGDSPKHGHAEYVYDVTTGQGTWTMIFHWSGAAQKVKTHVFKQVSARPIFIHIDRDKAYNAVLVPQE